MTVAIRTVSTCAGIASVAAIRRPPRVTISRSCPSTEPASASSRDLHLERAAVDFELDRGGGALEAVEVVHEGERPALVEADHLEYTVAAVEAVVAERTIASAVGVIVPSTLASSAMPSPREATSSAALDGLEHRRQALADPDAHRRDPVAAAAAAELVQERGGEAGAGAAERVAEGDRAAVDVEALLVDSELADAGEHLRGEGLVQLDQVDLVELEAGGGEGPGIASTGPMPM